MIKFLITLVLSAFLVTGVFADISSRIPMIQVGTGSTEAYYNIWGPRLATYQLKAYQLVNGSKGQLVSVSSSVEGTYTDKEGKLHDKVTRVKLSGLQPDTRYIIEVIQQVNNIGPNLVVEEREISTFSDQVRPLTIAMLSCMSDDPEFEKIKFKIWPALLEKNPDLILMMGDLTYVDSFKRVARGSATDFDVAMRYLRAFSENPVTRSYRVARVAGVIDDHDTGVDNGNSTTPTLQEAQRAFRALYSSPDVKGYVQYSQSGLYSFMTLRGINFALMDNRSFRLPFSANSRYGYWGKQQEEALLEFLKGSPNPTVIVDGGLITSPLVSFQRKDGTEKRITEGLLADHPANFTPFMQQLMATGSNIVFLNGDIHAAQIVELGPHLKGTPREFHVPTFEITSSPMYSILMNQNPGQYEIWPDLQRVVGRKTYNFAILQAKPTPEEGGRFGLDVQAQFFDQEGNLMFSRGGVVGASTTKATQRRLLLDRSFKVRNKKVKVVFLNIQGTIATPLNPIAPGEIQIFPGVAKKIAALNKKGYLVALIDNLDNAGAEEITLVKADQYYRKIIEQLKAENPAAIVHYYDFSERGTEDYYQKPNPGMPLHLWRHLKMANIEIDWGNSFVISHLIYSKSEVDPFGVIGTAPNSSDRLLAQVLNLRAIDAKEYFGWKADLTLQMGGCVQPLVKMGIKP